VLLKGVEILAVGEWPASERLRMTEEELDGIVSAFSSLNMAGRVPLKLGHEGPDAREDPASQYAMGWVQSIYRDGKVLKADFDVTMKVYQALQEKRLKFVSVELLKNVQAGNRQIPYVLDAVALLGSDQPAVGVLKEMQASIAARRTPLRSGGRVTLAQGNRTETTEVKKQMDEKEVQALIAASMKPLQDQLKLATDAATAANVAREASEKAAKEQSIKFKREQINSLFNAAIEAKTLEPAKRESFIKLTKYDKDDAATVSLELTEVSAYIKDNSKAPPKVTATSVGKSADDEKDLKPAEIIRHRVRKVFAAKRIENPTSQQYIRATRDVLEVADKALVSAYKNADQEMTSEDAA
jgi:hypothetical protein